MIHRCLRFSLILFAFSAWLSAASAPARAATDYPLITPQDLALKDNPAEPGAPAMILYRDEYINSRDDHDFYELHFFRFKIFTDAGKNYANVQLAFEKGWLDVTDVSGRTIHPDGKVIEFDGKVLEKTVVKAGEFKEQVKSFTLPDVIPGSIIEYKYRVQRPGLLFGAAWTVQGNIFTRKAHFVFVPYSRALISSLLWKAYLLEDVKPYKQSDGSWAMDVENVPGVPEEDFMLPQSELRGWLEFYYSNDVSPTDPQKYWDHIAKLWAEENDKFTSTRDPLKAVVSEVTSPSDSPETKLRKLYARAQKIHNLDFDPGKTLQERKREKVKINTNAADVLKHDAASSTNVNRFFVALAQAAGLEAGLAWVEARSRGIFHAEMLEAETLDQSLVWVRAGDKEYYLDPGTKFCPFGILPWYGSAVSGMRPTKQGPVYFVTPIAAAGKSTVERTADLTLSTDGALSGKISVTYSGQRALVKRIEERNDDETGRKKLITDEMKDLLPRDAKFELESVTGWDTSEGTIDVHGTVTIPSVTQMAGKRILMPVGLYLSGHTQIFNSLSRKQDIHFSFPYETVDTFVIHLPAGWSADALPDPRTHSPGGGLQYHVSVTSDGSALHIVRKLAVGDVLYPVDSYSNLRTFFRIARSDDEQQLVLQTAPSSGRN